MNELYPHDKPRRDVICPFCGKQGFDNRGVEIVDNKTMAYLTCHNCGTDFAVKIPKHSQ